MRILRLSKISTSIVISFLILSAIGCRKEVDRGPSLGNELVTNTPNQNQNPAPIAATPPCSIANDQLYLSGVGTSSITSPVCNSNGNFTGNLSYGTISISLGRTPDVTQTYTIDGMFITATLNSPSIYGNMSASGGTLNFNYSNGQYSVTLCSGAFYSYVTGNAYTVNCNIK